MRTKTTTATTTRQHVRLLPRRVCPLFLRNQENLVFCELFVNNTMCRCFRFPCSSFLFFGSIFAKVSQIPCFFVLFLSLILASFSKFLSGKLQNREVFAWSTCGKPSNKYLEMTTKTIATDQGRRRSTKKKECTSRSRMDVITPLPHHCTAPPHSRRRSTKEKENTSRIRMDGLCRCCCCFCYYPNCNTGMHFRICKNCFLSRLELQPSVVLENKFHGSGASLEAVPTCRSRGSPHEALRFTT